jgi:hypothetical protein
MNRKRFTDTTAWKLILTAIELAAIIGIIWYVIYFLQSMAFAEEEQCTEMFVICQPNDYVNARYGASRKSMCVGRLECGDRVVTDGKKKNGFLHIVGAGFETDEAWVHAGYLAYDPPEWVGRTATVISRSTLMARRFIGGKVRKKLYTGDELTVYWKTDEWCVTSQGFVMTRYLELDGE